MALELACSVPDDFQYDESYIFVKEFPETIEQFSEKDVLVQWITRLMNCAPQLLVQYPSHPVVITTVCKAIIQAVRIKAFHSTMALESEDTLDSVIYLTSGMYQVEWQSQRPALVGMVCEAVTSILTLYPVTNTHDITQMVASFLRELFAMFSSDISAKDRLIALGSSFPSTLPNGVYIIMSEQEVHEDLRNLIPLYTEMDPLDFTNILKALCSFLRARKSIATTFIINSTHFLLLFAAQHFQNSCEVQNTLWSLLSLLLTQSEQFAVELNPAVLLPTIISVINDSNILPIVNVLSEYIMFSGSDPPLVVSCLQEYPELLTKTFLPLLDPSRTLEPLKKRDEVVALSELLELFFGIIYDKDGTAYSTVEYLMKYGILEALKRAAMEWPDLCCVSYCTAMRRLVEHFPHSALMRDYSPSSIPESFTNTVSVQATEFYKDNQILPFIELLFCSVITQEIYEAIIDTVKYVFKIVPSSVLEEWTSDELLMSFLTSLSKHVNGFREKMINFMPLAHLLVHALKADRVQVLRAQEWHRVIIDECIDLSSGYSEVHFECIHVAACIFQRYHQSTEDILPFINSDFPRMIVTFGKMYGRYDQRSSGIYLDIRELFRSVILTMIADKQASLILHRNGFLNGLFPLVDELYHPLVVQAVIHAIGNISLYSDEAKQEIVGRGFHTVLMDFINAAVDCDLTVLSACCRLLHILALSEQVKHAFIESSLSHPVLQLMEVQKNVSMPVYLQALGFLKLLEFFAASSCSQYVVPEKILKSFHCLLKANTNTREGSYIAYVFLASVEGKGGRVEVREVFQQVLQETSDDFIRFDPSISTKGSLKLFTIPLHSKYLALNVHEQELLANFLDQNVLQPEISPIGCRLSEQMNSEPSTIRVEGSEGWSNNKTPDFDSFPDTFSEYVNLDVGVASRDRDDTFREIAQLGVNPNTMFRIDKFYCRSIGELSFTPRNLTPHQYQELITRGWFRRGGVSLYRSRSSSNISNEEWETRVLVSEFDHTHYKSYKKVLRRMPKDRVTIETVPAQFIPEVYDLYNSYQFTRHNIPAVSESIYYQKMVNNPVRNQSIDGFQYGTFHQLYRLDGKLAGVGVIDIVPNGIVSVYMWYNTSKEVSKYSFGVYSTLKEIEFAKELSKCNPNIKYYYLQGWRDSNERLGYKTKFEPEEFYSPCVVPDWVLGLDSVFEAVELAKRKWIEAKEDHIPLMIDISPIASGKAFPLDCVRHHLQHGPDKPNVMSTVVCLNPEEEHLPATQATSHVYMYLGQVLDMYSITGYQRENVIEYFTELYYAVGPELAQDLIVGLTTSPVTGNPLELGRF